jgi:hypothetical protein
MSIESKDSPAFPKDEVDDIDLSSAYDAVAKDFPDDFHGLDKNSILQAVDTFIKSPNDINVGTSPGVLVTSNDWTDCAISAGLVVYNALSTFLSYIGLKITYSDMIRIDLGIQLGGAGLAEVERIGAMMMGASSIDQAKGLVKMLSALSDINVWGNIWRIIKNEMSFTDWVVAIVTATARFTLLFTTGGTAFIAALIGQSTSLYYFVQSCNNMRNTCGRGFRGLKSNNYIPSTIYKFTKMSAFQSQFNDTYTFVFDTNGKLMVNTETPTDPYVAGPVLDGSSNMMCTVWGTATTINFGITTILKWGAERVLVESWHDQVDFITIA